MSLVRFFVVLFALLVSFPGADALAAKVQLSAGRVVPPTQAFQGVALAHPDSTVAQVAARPQGALLDIPSTSAIGPVGRPILPQGPALKVSTSRLVVGNQLLPFRRELTVLSEIGLDQSLRSYTASGRSMAAAHLALVQGRQERSSFVEQLKKELLVLSERHGGERVLRYADLHRLMGRSYNLWRTSSMNAENDIRLRPLHRLFGRPISTHLDWNTRLFIYASSNLTPASELSLGDVASLTVDDPSGENEEAYELDRVGDTRMVYAPGTTHRGPYLGFRPVILALGIASATREFQIPDDA